MKFKKYTLFMMLLTSMTLMSSFVSHNDNEFEEITPEYAQKELQHDSVLERDVMRHKALERIKTELPKSTIEISGETGTKTTGFFGKALKFVKDPLKKSSLEHQFKAHAQQTNDNPLVLTDSDTEFFKSLSTKDQQELIDLWAKTHKDTFEHFLDKNHQQYTKDVNDYKNGDQNAQMRTVNNNENDITNNNKTIQRKKVKIKTIDTELENTNLTDAKRKKLQSDKNQLESDINGLESANMQKQIMNTETLNKIKTNHSALDENYKVRINVIHRRYDARNEALFNTIKGMLSNKTVTNTTEKTPQIETSQPEPTSARAISSTRMFDEDQPLPKATEEDWKRTQFEDFFKNWTQDQPKKSAKLNVGITTSEPETNYKEEFKNKSKQDLQDMKQLLENLKNRNKADQAKLDAVNNLLNS